MFREDNVEQAIIEQLKELGYEYQYAPDIERDYKEAIWKDVFYESLYKKYHWIKSIADRCFNKDYDSHPLRDPSPLNVTLHALRSRPSLYNKNGLSLSK